MRIPIFDGQPEPFAEFDVADEHLADGDGSWGTEPLARRSGDPAGRSAPGGAGRPDGSATAHTLTTSLDTSLDTVLPTLSLILAKLRAGVSGCDEISLQLGLRVGGETGLVFVRGSADASIGVTVTWRRSDVPGPPGSGQERPEPTTSLADDAATGTAVEGVDGPR